MILSSNQEDLRSLSEYPVLDDHLCKVPAGRRGGRTHLEEGCSWCHCIGCSHCSRCSRCSPGCSPRLSPCSLVFTNTGQRWRWDMCWPGPRHVAPQHHTYNSLLLTTTTCQLTYRQIQTVTESFIAAYIVSLHPRGYRQMIKP